MTGFLFVQKTHVVEPNYTKYIRTVTKGSGLASLFLSIQPTVRIGLGRYLSIDRLAIKFIVRMATSITFDLPTGFSVTAGVPCEISWQGNDGSSVTLTLVQGSSENVSTVTVIVCKYGNLCHT